MDGLIDPDIYITNSTPLTQVVHWQVTATDFKGDKVIPVNNDRGVATVSPGQTISQKFNWILLFGGVSLNEVIVTSVDTNGVEEVAILAQSVYEDDAYVIHGTNLFVDITPNQINFTSRITSKNAALHPPMIIVIILLTLIIIVLLIIIIKNITDVSTKK